MALPLCQQLLLPPATPSLTDVARVDPSLGSALREIARTAAAAGAAAAVSGAAEGGDGGGKEGKLGEYLAALHLFFTLPGADWWVKVLVVPIATRTTAATSS